MHPVSKERVEWIVARLKLLEEMFAELRDRPTKYLNSSGIAHRAMEQNALNTALGKVAGEQLELRVELEVLQRLYESGDEGAR